MSQLRVRLKDVAKRIQYGYTASASDDESIGPKFLRITDIVPDQIDWLNVPFCPIEENLFDKYALHSGDIVIARTGNTTGYAKLIREEQRAIFASYLIRVQLDERKADPGFVGRLVESNAYKQFVNSQKGGAAQGNANAQVLTLFEFILPPLQIQHKIASILSAYDDLIENNRRRMALLEESARLLYREWFVHLHFPGHARTRITDGVPKGWKQTNLIDVCASLEDGDWIESKDQGGEDYRLLQISNIGMNDFVETGNLRFISEETYRRLNCREIKPGDILISRMPTPIGRAWLVSEMPWKMVTAVDVAILTTDPASADSYFLLYHLNSPSNIAHCERRAVGATRPRIARRELAGTPVLLPPASLQRQFRDIVMPINEQRTCLNRQNQKLRAARDLLLPRLISGEIAP